MSTQAYYKDRLGFDPREALYETTPVNSNHHHTSSTSRTHKSGSSRHSRKENYTSNSHHYSHHHQQQHHNQHQQYSESRHQHHHSATSADYIDSPNAKKQKQQQDGYEDALTQFKGTMSVWEYFIENVDHCGKSVVQCVIHV